MSEHKNTPELRFPEFKDEWYQSNLDEMCSFTSGGTPSRKINKYWDGDIPWITTSDLNNKFIKNIFTKITSSGLKNSSAKLITEPAIILAMYGQGKTRGKCSILNFPATTNQACAILQPNEFNNIEFVYQFLEKNYTYLRAQSNEGSQKNLSLSLLKKIKINYPSLFEQNKISDFFSKLDHQIELEEKKLELLEQQKRGYMQKIFSQELRFKDANGNSYPKWEQEKLDDVANYRRGSFPQPYGKREWYDEINGEPFVQVVDVDKNMKLHNQTKQKISNLAKPKSVKGFIGDIVVTLQGSIGRVAILQYDAYIDRTLLLINSFKIEMNKDYFKYVLYLLFLKEKERAPGGTIKTITKTVLSNFKIDVPIIEEQEKIGNLFNALDKTIEIQGDKVNFLKQRKQGLLQKMFV
ncbi:restriction endonuclease subunit S [Staphylococcus petrasii]|uniref:restriction endonuclease subunit S n=1 Tax=Staphylococcus petrasii TaxID=1276936 RepID=UPI000CD1F49F|nr:restriction endonuclease subunit S [Staphylococcus petrasii]PNZ84682.1 restriction endonuclease subunit S [Staphylococcus petrasii]TGA81221.1 restriction endonuclease subunit S [Staphylococcus petrasii]SUM58671.1 putative restriction and modification system specificity protein [Staphylococcus petrasii]